METLLSWEAALRALTASDTAHGAGEAVRAVRPRAGDTCPRTGDTCVPAQVTRASPQLCPGTSTPAPAGTGEAQPADAAAQNNAASYKGLLCYKRLLETSP